MNSNPPQSIRRPRGLRKQFFGQSVPLNFGYPVRCQPADLDALVAQAHADGYGIATVEHDPANKRQFIVRFLPVESYRNQITIETQP